MTRNLKAIGLALVAVLAIGAVAASAAQAEEDPGIIESNSETYPLKLSGEGNEEEKFTAFGAEVTCEKSEYSGEVSEASEEVTVEPEYSECHSVVPLIGKVPVTVTTNGCTYRLYDATTEAVQPEDPNLHTYNLTTDIVCPENQEIEVHIYLSQEAHEEDNSACTLSVGSQTDKEGLTADVNTEDGDVTLTGTVGGLHVEQERNFFLCPSGTEEDGGVYHVRPGGVTVTGEDENGQANPFRIEMGAET